MNKSNLFQYVGNLYKKSLEIFISKLKTNVSKHLENNDLQKSKEIIKKIEAIRKFQSEIDSIVQDYFKYFPEENSAIENVPISDKSTNNFTHYTSEILEVIKSEERIELFELKSLLYNAIVKHIDAREISNNDKLPGLLNWEVNFYKSVTFLLSKGLIKLDSDYYFYLTTKGEEFYGENSDDFEKDLPENINDLENVDEMFHTLVEKDKDLDMITSIRSYLLSNLIATGTITAYEDLYCYDDVFFVIKELYNIDGQLIESWEKIKENEYYIINSYFGKNSLTIFVKEKHDIYNVLECVNENDSDAYYAFI